MPIESICPSCGLRFRVGDEFAQKRVSCPKCQMSLMATGPQVPPYDAFISYSSKDKAIADAVVATLEADGVRCWVAPRDIVPGKEWSEAIIDGINKSRMVVLIFSTNSNASQQVLREVERAVNRGMPIVPFRIENLLPSRGMEYFISASHWLDAYHPPLDSHLQKLSATAQSLLNGMATPQEEKPANLRTRLRAAGKAMTARDNRVRVLAGLVALVFLIGAITFGAIYALRPKAPAVASPELVQAKADAEVLAEKVRVLDKGEGIGARADEVENHLKAGQANFGERRFEDANAHFKTIVAIAPQIIDDSRVREELKALQKAVQQDFAAASSKEVSRKSAGWPEAVKKKQSADDAFARGDFALARAAWKETQSLLADLHNTIDAIAEKKALCFWLGFAGKSLQAAIFQDELLAPRAKFTPHTPNDVSALTTMLRDQCKPRLGLKPELIDQLVNETNNNARHDFLLKKLPTAVRDTAELGVEIQRSYWFGHNLADLIWSLDSAVKIRFHQRLTSLATVATWFDPTVENAAAAGAPQELIAEIREVQAEFDKEFGTSIGRLNPDFKFADKAANRLVDILEKYAKDPEAAAKSFALTLTRPGPAGHEDALTELRRVRACVYFDDPKAPKSITEVWAFGPISDTSRTMAAISKLKSLERLHLGYNPFTDDDAAQLDELTQLKYLFLSQTRITDAALKHLKGMSKLRELYLLKTAVTDEGIMQLRELKELREVNVTDSKVTEKGGKALHAAMPRTKVVPFATKIEKEEIDNFLKDAGIGPDGELIKPKEKSKPPMAKKVYVGPAMKAPKEIAAIPTKFQQLDQFAVSVAIARDGKSVAAGGFEDGAAVQVWDPATRKKLATWDTENRLVPPQFTPDGRHLIDPTPQLFDIGAGKAIALQGGLAELSVISYGIAPDGKSIAFGLSAGKDTETKLLRIAKFPELTGTAAFVESFEGHVLAVNYSPDGSQLAVYLRDRDGHKLLRLDAKSGEIKSTFEKVAHDRPLNAGENPGNTGLAFSADGKMLAAFGKHPDGHRISWWDFETGKLRKSLLTRDCEAVAFIADGRLLVAGHDKPIDRNVENDPEGWAMYVYDVATGELRGRAELSEEGSLPNVLNPQLGLFATATPKGEVILWDLAKNQLGVKFKAHAGPVTAIAFSRDGKFMATFGRENKVKVWAIEN